MTFTSLSSLNFRNLSSESIKTDSENIVLTGLNGQGKTNILEEIYLLCYGSSFRTNQLKDCIKHGESSFFVSGTYLDGNDEGKISISYDGKTRKILLDNNEIKDRKELIYTFPCIIFSHEDIVYINGGPEERRKFFDQMLSLNSSLYFDNLRQYKRLLLQRNSALKNEEFDLFHIYDERLALLGLEIMEERREAVKEFNEIFPYLYRKISNSDEDINVSYLPSWADMTKEEIIDFLLSNEEKDIKNVTTTSGIQRDRFLILTPNGNFKDIGSTGQLRLCSLIFRVSEALFFNKKTGKKPIVLLDDVLLELDHQKRGVFLSLLTEYSQAFYTFLPDEDYEEKKENRIEYEVRNGRVYG